MSQQSFYQPSNKPDYVSTDWLKNFVKNAFEEDIKDGDHTSLSTIPESAEKTARCIAKQEGIIAGLELADFIFLQKHQGFSIDFYKKDGEQVKVGEELFRVTGLAREIVGAERLVLNAMQRMSGIATYTHYLKGLIKNSHTQLLDTRKTTPNLRPLEKWAVLIGGGKNHRLGLYDLIMIKDNHIDYAGSVGKAIEAAKSYLKNKSLSINIEVEARTIKEVEEILEHEGVSTILLDNMDTDTLTKCITLINGKCSTEASGGVNESTITAISETGVDFISVGALTHSYKSLDISLKAVK